MGERDERDRRITMCLVLFTLWIYSSIDSAQTYLCQAQRHWCAVGNTKKGNINSFSSIPKSRYKYTGRKIIKFGLIAMCSED